MTSAAPPSASPAPPSTDESVFAGYEFNTAYDEMFAGDGRPRPHYAARPGRLARTPPDDCRRRQAMTALSRREAGVGVT
ncbi:MAG: circularly permuted type 2 ATP-grasp protein, partial [Planctomycetaceae bacterium]